MPPINSKLSKSNGSSSKKSKLGKRILVDTDSDSEFDSTDSEEIDISFENELEYAKIQASLSKNKKRPRSQNAARANADDDNDRTPGETNTQFSLNLSHWLSIEQIISYVQSRAGTLERIKFEFSNTTQFRDVFNTMYERNIKPKLKNLAINFTEPNESLNAKQLLILSTKLDLTALESLELGCGLWEDVHGPSLTSFLQSCAKTLKSFKLSGNFQGEDEWQKVLSFELPEMDELEEFSFGSNYDFLSVYESHEPNRTPAATTECVSLDELQLLRTKISFPNELLNLKSLTLGNLASVANMNEITRAKFPSLNSFRVGSAWNDSIELLETDTYSIPTWPSIHELQLPDCLRDEKFISKLFRMFPNVTKIWYNLPSALCLRRFFFTMQRSKLRELYLQTQYDFTYVLESAFITKPFDVHDVIRNSNKTNARRAGPSSSSAAASDYNTLEDLEKLKNPNNCDQIYKDFIHHHNMSLPLTKEEMSKHEYGISSLSKLQVLEFHHVPRLLRIPTSNTILFTSPNATFNQRRRFGFMKYPLAEKLFTEEFPKLKNLKRLKFLGENFVVSRDVWMKFCKRCHFNNFHDWNEERDDLNEAVKDKLEPSKISRAKEFLPKPESEPSPLFGGTQPSSSSFTSTTGSGGIPLINPYSNSTAPIKIEIKEERP